MSEVIGTRTDGSTITTDTPAYEIDSTTTANVTYIRYENTTSSQLIQRVDESGATTKIQWTHAAWTGRVAATYTDRP